MSGIRGDDRVNMMDENPELRWFFIHKVYSITIFQLLLTIAVFSVLLFVPPIAKFFNYNYYVLFTIAFFALLLVEYHHQKHPLCYFLLLIFTVSFALSLGLICVDYLSRNINLVVALNTGVVVFILTIYTFWAVKRGGDFDFLYPFLSRAVRVLYLIMVIEFLLPLGMFSNIINVCFLMIIGCLTFIIFCGNIVYDTNTLIKRYSYAKYISVSITLYLEVIILFLSLSMLYFIAQSAISHCYK